MPKSLNPKSPLPDTKSKVPKVPGTVDPQRLRELKEEWAQLTDSERAARSDVLLDGVGLGF